MMKTNYLKASIIVVLLLSAAGPMKPVAHPHPNPAAVDLLSVENFLALAATAVTSPTGPTTLIGGDLGITGVGCTDFPAPCTTPGVNGTVVGGAIQNANGVATTGQTDATAVVTDLNTRVADDPIGAGGLNGLTLERGVYDVTSVGGGGDDLTGDLTLTGGPNAIFIFRFNDTFITSGTARIVLAGGVQACNVYWTSASAMTFDGASQLAGTFFAQSDIDFTGGGAVVDGRVIAQTAAIDFRNTTINSSPCVVPPAPTAEVEDEDIEGDIEEAIVALPDSGGAPIRKEVTFPWSLVAVGGVSALALAAGVQAYRRRTHRKQ